MDTATQRIETGTAPEAQHAPAEVLALPVRATPEPARLIQLADRGAKRALDVFVAGALLLVLSPLIALASVLIVLDSPGRRLLPLPSAPASGAAACGCSSSARCATAPADAR